MYLYINNYYKNFIIIFYNNCKRLFIKDVILQEEALIKEKTLEAQIIKIKNI